MLYLNHEGSAGSNVHRLPWQAVVPVAPAFLVFTIFIRILCFVLTRSPAIPGSHRLGPSTWPGVATYAADGEPRNTEEVCGRPHVQPDSRMSTGSEPQACSSDTTDPLFPAAHSQLRSEQRRTERSLRPPYALSGLVAVR